MNTPDTVVTSNNPADLFAELQRLRAENLALREVNIRVVKPKAPAKESLPTLSAYDKSLLFSISDIANTLAAAGICSEPDVSDARYFVHLFGLVAHAQFKEDVGQRGRGQFLYLTADIGRAVGEVLKFRSL